jgi:hypothetical protein
MLKVMNLLLLLATLYASTKAFQSATHYSHAFGIRQATTKTSRCIFHATTEDQPAMKMSQGVEEYKNTATKVLANFMQKEDMSEDPFADIDWGAPKIPATTSLKTLAAALDFELIEKEWFVTGRVNPSYFSNDFEFQDPDVQLKGIEEYARGVRKLFDQSTSRAEIMSTVVNTTASTEDKPMITCTWRLSGGVNIAFGLSIKPYIVFTDFVVDPETSLIISQEDRFDIPGWDILLRWVRQDFGFKDRKSFISFEKIQAIVLANLDIHLTRSFVLLGLHLQLVVSISYWQNHSSSRPASSQTRCKDAQFAIFFSIEVAFRHFERPFQRGRHNRLQVI